MSDPHFKFYPQRWLRSERVQGMSLEEQGAYFRLLCLSYPDGIGVKDTAELSEGWTDQTKDRILGAFINVEGRLFHPILLEDAEKKRRKSEACKRAGMASGRRRRKKPAESTPATPDTRPEPEVDTADFALTNPTLEETRVKTAREKARTSAEIFSEIAYDYYKKNIRVGEKQRCMKNVVKILQRKEATPKELMKAMEHYTQSTNFSPDPEFRKNAGNFFGVDATWKDYVKGPIIVDGPGAKKPPWEAAGMSKAAYLKKQKESGEDGENKRYWDDDWRVEKTRRGIGKD